MRRLGQALVVAALFLLAGFALAPRFSRRESDLLSAELLTAIKLSSGIWQPVSEPAVFNSQPVEDGGYLAQGPESEDTAVLAAYTDSGKEKWIEIDLSDQRLYAWEGEKLIYEFPVSTGLWASTPEGEFEIWIKLRYTLMAGGKKELGTYYYLPNVPYVMYFHGGYGIHGAYWHNNFGQPMSHGCVNMAIDDAGKIYGWAHPRTESGQGVTYPSADNPATRILIHR